MRRAYTVADARLAAGVEEQHRRFFWRVRHRLGPGWDKMTDAEVRRYLRQVSWRRVI